MERSTLIVLAFTAVTITLIRLVALPNVGSGSVDSFGAQRQFLCP